jgi:hypothetical protein
LKTKIRGSLSAGSVLVEIPACRNRTQRIWNVSMSAVLPRASPRLTFNADWPSLEDRDEAQYELRKQEQSRRGEK